jgi:endoribonuclease Dicer
MGDSIDAVDTMEVDIGVPYTQPQKPEQNDINGIDVNIGSLSIDDEPEPLPEIIDPPKKFRLEQQDLFKDLVLQNAAKIDEAQECNKQKRKIDGKLQEGLTIEQLMKEQGKQAMDNPREYQNELFERAKKENTIAVLETGSGKTLIAVLLIRWVLDQELEDRAKGMPARTTFFMVSSASKYLVHVLT